MRTICGIIIIFVIYLWNPGVTLQAQPASTRSITPLLVLSQTAEGTISQSDIQFDRLTLPGGLAGNFIVDLVQDKSGYMWFATHGGLHRFDGYEFITYTHNPDDPHSLSSSLLECLYMDREGTLWVGTFGGGLNRFDSKSHTFIRYRFDPTDPASISQDSVTVIIEDQTGALWVGTHGGLNRLDRETGRFTRFLHHENDSTSLSHNRVRALYTDREGTLWVGTGSPFESSSDEGGLNRFDPASGSFTRYFHEPGNDQSLLHNHIRALFEDSRGRFWVGTWDSGLHIMDRKRGSFTRQNPGNLGGSPRPITPDRAGENGISFVFEDRANALWIGSFGGGLLRYDPVEETKQVLTLGLDEPEGMEDNVVWEMYESRDGVLWIASWGGLYRIVPLGGSFPHVYITDAQRSVDNRVTALFEDVTGEVWVGTVSTGLVRYDRSRGTFEQFAYSSANVKRISNRTVQSIIRDRQGDLWIGTRSGLNRFDNTSGTFVHYLHDPANVNSLSDNDIVVVFGDRDGALWIGTNSGGLNRLDPRTGQFTRYRHSPDDPATISSNVVSRSAILQDHSGAIWVGTNNGLNRLDPETGKFIRYQPRPDDARSISGRDITGLHEDREGRLWIATSDGGLNRYDPASGGFVHYTQHNSTLPTNSIFSLIGDREDRLWIGLENAILRVDPQTFSFTIYSTENRLAATPLIPGSVHYGRGGELYFGGMNGFHVFRPEDVMGNPIPPQVHVTDLRLPHGSISEMNALQDVISNSGSITLKPDQNIFSIDFVGLHFTGSAYNRYTYILENYDESWREVGLQRSATYYKVPPGRYTFRVKAANADGIWNEEGTHLDIIIQAPWYRTWWAYLFYGLLVIGLIILFDRVQRKRVIRAERIRSFVRESELQAKALRAENERNRIELEKARELAKAYLELEQAHEHLKSTQTQLVRQEKMASLGQLTAGVAHEIRNPLNFINNFSELNAEITEELLADLGTKDVPPDHIRDMLKILRINDVKIAEQGRRVNDIVRTMLQHSRAIPDKKVPTDLNGLLDEYINLAYHGMKGRLEHFNVTIERHFDERIGLLQLAPQEMGIVFINILNNAFYALYQRKVEENGEFTPVVNIRTRMLPGRVEVRITDNGPGIPFGIKDRIFEPFFTTKPAGSGTGLGLSLVYQIVTHGHSGNVHVESQEGAGTSFTVSLPYSTTRIGKHQLSRVHNQEV